MSEIPKEFSVMTVSQDAPVEGRRIDPFGQFAVIRVVKPFLTDTDSPTTQQGRSTQHRDDPNWQFGKNPPDFTPGGV